MIDVFLWIAASPFLVILTVIITTIICAGRP
jgi:hypothetical protein